MKRRIVQELRFDIISENVITYEIYYWKKDIRYESAEQIQMAWEEVVKEWENSKKLVTKPTVKEYWKVLETTVYDYIGEKN